MLHRTTSTVLLPLLGGCVAGTGSSSDAADAASTGTSSPATSDEHDSSEGTSESGDELCGIDPGDAPWITIWQFDEKIVEGSSLRIVCGGQGTFMIYLELTMGGFTPSDPLVPLHATLDVAGYNLGRGGHFGEFEGNIFAGCCTHDYNSPFYYYCYGGNDPRNFILYPPDMIADLGVLHELPATLHIAMSAEGTLVEQTIAVEMWALDNGYWGDCIVNTDGSPSDSGTTTGYGTSGLAEPPLELALPIPL